MTEEEFYQKYPKLFRRKDLPASESCMCWGIGIPKSWYGLFEEACEQLQRLSDANNVQIEMEQVKTKFGSLRIYFDIVGEASEHVKQRADIIIHEAEVKAARTCETCGKPGKRYVESGWVVVLCEEHAKALNAVEDDQ